MTGDKANHASFEPSSSLNQHREIAVLFLHPGCNMTCLYCISDETFDAMSQDQALGLINTLAAGGVTNVVLGGGEPLAWPGDLYGLAAHAKAQGLLVQVGTNGIALPEGFEHAAAVDRYVLPLDAADAATHNQLRRYKRQHFEIIMDRLEKLRSAGKGVTVSTVVNAQTALGLPRLARFLHEYCDNGGQVHAWHLYKFLPLGRGGAKHDDELHISDLGYTEACDHVKSLELPFVIYRRKDMFHSRSVDFYWYERGELRVGSQVWGERPAAVGVPDRWFCEGGR
jgi:MoaA/NifB/PqqE/SkfB family radical SAM enzyme